MSEHDHDKKKQHDESKDEAHKDEGYSGPAPNDPNDGGEGGITIGGPPAPPPENP